MTEREYRASEGISRSELWKLNPRRGGSPEKFMYSIECPDEPTPAMVFGTLAHLALLEPGKFSDEFMLAPDVDRRTKEGKAAWAEFNDKLAGRVGVSKDDWATVNRMAKSLLDYPACKRLLSGVHESSVFWTDPDTGEKCKIRADAITAIGGTDVIVDYKTTTDASYDAFARKAIQMGYDFQAGMYCTGYEQVFGVKPRFVFIVQEKDEPFAVNVLEADEGFIQRGKDTFRELISIYHECKATGNWWGHMGPDMVIGKLSVPAWADKE